MPIGMFLMSSARPALVELARFDRQRHAIDDERAVGLVAEADVRQRDGSGQFAGIAPGVIDFRRLRQNRHQPLVGGYDAH
jgi:hypothetical protein